MKRIFWIIALLSIGAACGGNGRGTEDGDTAAVLAAAVEQLITVDHTFGVGPPPFSRYLLLEATDPTAGSGDESDAVSRNLTDSERTAVESVASRFGPVQWIDDAEDHRTEDLLPVVEGAVIIGVGEPIFDRDGALVPVSLWCGGLCGTWLTYRVELGDGAWTVTGIEGPIAVS